MGKRVVKGVLIAVGVIVVAFGIYAVYVFGSYYRLDDNLALEVEPPLAAAAASGGVETVGEGAAEGEGTAEGDAADATEVTAEDDTTADAATSGEAEPPEDAGAESAAIVPGEEYVIATANLGFGAYDQAFDFFMDGGSGSWAASPETAEADIVGSAKAIAQLDPDFVLFQEVDVDGTRSYHINEYQLLREQFPADWSVFAQNYDSPFLAWPPYQPHGANKAGLVTFCAAEPVGSLRRSLPISESLTKILDLDRCYSVTRIPVGEHELVLINLHLSAYGADASVMASQREMLYQDMVAEYQAGNWVIAGGDFNHDMIGVSGEVFGNATSETEGWAKPYDFDGVPEGFTVAAKAKLDAEGEAYDDAATCRDTGRPWDGTNDRWVLDTFITSDNVEVTFLETLDLEFAYSDHNPVQMRFKLV